jgi:addiction module HigA family antidote
MELPTFDEALPPIHPGEILKAEFMDELGLGAADLASRCHVPTDRIVDVVEGRSRLDGDLALRLGKVFGVPAMFWMNLQGRYDIERAAHGPGVDLDAIVTLGHAAE